MFVELHMIQSFAPSNLNRDDTGAPKDCEFGGVRRARISSQCIKRATRRSDVFKAMLEKHLSHRSLRFPDQVIHALKEKGIADQAQLNAIGSQLEKIAKKEEEKPRDKEKAEADQRRIFKTPQIIFFTHREVEQCAERIIQLLNDGTKAKDIVDTKNRKLKDGKPLPTPRTADIGLFGRMVTSEAFKNMDAACQVAHAISTHKVSMEFDFYTAVDDLNPKEETGAGMMGTVEFNSACYYRYANIDLEQLKMNLGNDEELARKTVEAFVRASASAIPTGKQNSFAAQNPPSFILAVLKRGGTPLSLANAFEKPVRPDREGGIVENSIKALDEYWTKLTKAYGWDRVEHIAIMVGDKPKLDNFRSVAFEQLVEFVMGNLEFKQNGKE